MCDWSKLVQLCSGKGGEEGDRLRGGILGLGYLLATAVFAHGYWNGCRKAEILAINDNGKRITVKLQ